MNVSAKERSDERRRTSAAKRGDGRNARARDARSDDDDDDIDEGFDDDRNERSKSEIRRVIGDDEPIGLARALDRLERARRDYALDVERCVTNAIEEIRGERAREMNEVNALRKEVLKGKDLLERERREFEVKKAMQRDEIERAYELLQRERDAFASERARVEEERIRVDAEAKISERYARMGAPYARSLSIPSQTLADDDRDLSGFENTVKAWRDAPEAAIERAPSETVAASRWIGAKKKVTDVNHALENMSLTRDAERNARGGIKVEVARASAVEGLELMGRVLCIGGLERGSDTPLRTVEFILPDSSEDGYLSWKPFAALNTPRAYAACSTTAIGGAVVIGGSDGHEALRSVEEYRESVGKWRAVDPMSVPRIWCASTMIDGVTFAVGGYDGEYYLHSVEANKTLGSFDHSSTTPADSGLGSQPSSSWVTCAPMSEGRATLGVANLSGKMYAVGGFSADGRVLDLCETYDPRADVWSTSEPLKHKRRDLGVVSLSSRGTILAIGGRDDRSVLSVVESFDPRDAKRGWRELAPMQYRRQLHATVPDPAGDAVYVIGGFDGVSAISAVEVYDIRANKWRETAPTNSARLGVVSCCIP